MPAVSCIPGSAPRAPHHGTSAGIAPSRRPTPLSRAACWTGAGRLGLACGSEMPKWYSMCQASPGASRLWGAQTLPSAHAASPRQNPDSPDRAASRLRSVEPEPDWQVAGEVTVELWCGNQWK